MEKVFIELIKQLNSSVFILLGVVFGAFIASWKLSTFIATWKTKHQHHETALDKIEKKIDMIPAMSGKLELIYNNTLRQPVVASHSPIGLTDFGKKIATNIKADGFVDRHYNLFLDCLGVDYQRLNAFDIQKSLFSYIGGEFKESKP